MNDKIAHLLNEVDWRKTMRKLVTIRTVSEVRPIPAADALEVAYFGGWPSVMKKNQVKPGDKCVFFEIDSFIPLGDERFAFLESKATRYMDATGVRLRTIRLRGQISQGLAFPVSDFPELKDAQEDVDLSDFFGVIKWEPPVVESAEGVIGDMPSFLRKTDQERVQNLVKEIQDNQGQEFEVTVKLDGMSMTVYHLNPLSQFNESTQAKTGVCGRNKEFEQTADNMLWNTAIQGDVIKALTLTGKNIALQGELMGPKIQGNHENLSKKEFYVFDVFDIDQQKYFSPDERQAFFDHLTDLGVRLNQVPCLGKMVLDKSVEEILAMADGPSLNNEKREGIVFKRMDGKFSFKAISNWYLEKFADR